MKDIVARAIELRKSQKPEEALALLQVSLRSHPLDPDLNYQMAWTCDSMGKESEAAPFYEAALANGLLEDRSGAQLGLASTYRCLGEYQKSLEVFDRAIEEFPEDRPLRVFRALTLYNLGRSQESLQALLTQLLDTTNDPSIRAYEIALRFYAGNLSETWK